MSDDVYHRLAKVLDTLPNGFPATDSGIEIQLLKKIFRPKDVDLFCDLRLNWETAQQIAERTGRPLEGLEQHLDEMQQLGIHEAFGETVEHDKGRSCHNGGYKIYSYEAAFQRLIFIFDLHLRISSSLISSDPQRSFTCSGPKKPEFYCGI